jgi:glycosyl transferase, family 25
MKSFVINLDRDAARLRHIEDEFKRAGMEFERFPAVDGAQLKPDDITFLPATARHRPWTRGEIGCFLSHYELWKILAASKLRYCAIFEDDVFLSRKVSGFLRAVERSQACFDLLKIDSGLRLVSVDRFPMSVVAGVALHRLRSIHYGTGAYLISRDAAELLVERVSGFDLPVDDVLFGPHPASSDLFVVQSIPALVAQSDVMIGAEHRPALRGSLQGERELVRKSQLSEASLASGARENLVENLMGVLANVVFRATRKMRDVALRRRAIIPIAADVGHPS